MSRSISQIVFWLLREMTPSGVIITSKEVPGPPLQAASLWLVDFGVMEEEGSIQPRRMTAGPGVYRDISHKRLGTKDRLHSSCSPRAGGGGAWIPPPLHGTGFNPFSTVCSESCSRVKSHH